MSYQTINTESGHATWGCGACLLFGFLAVSFALPLIKTHSFTIANVSLAILSMCISIFLLRETAFFLFVLLCVVITVIALTVWYWHGPDTHSAQGTQQTINTDFSNKQVEATR